MYTIQREFPRFNRFGIVSEASVAHMMSGALLVYGSKLRLVDDRQLNLTTRLNLPRFQI